MNNNDWSPVLFIFGGLPGSGKSTIASSLARQVHATYVRLDSIEQVIRNSSSSKSELGPEGYFVAYRIAHDNLTNGISVIADSANTITVTRQAWLDIATNSGARSVQIEVFCSDVSEHRKRVEGRYSSIPGLALPTWEQVCSRKYEKWDNVDIRLDTFGRSPEESIGDITKILIEKSLLIN